MIYFCKKSLTPAYALSSTLIIHFGQDAHFTSNMIALGTRENYAEIALKCHLSL